MVGVAQLVRVPDCDSGCCRFESGHPPLKKDLASKLAGFFFLVRKQKSFSRLLFWTDCRVD